MSPSGTAYPKMGDRTTLAVDRDVADMVRKAAKKSNVAVFFYVSEALRHVVKNVNLNLVVEVSDKDKKSKRGK